MADADMNTTHNQGDADDASETSNARKPLMPRRRPRSGEVLPEELPGGTVIDLVPMPSAPAGSPLPSMFQPAWRSICLCDEWSHFPRYGDDDDPIESEIRAALAGEAPSPQMLTLPQRCVMVSALILREESLLGDRADRG
ncbi:hypothetical protein ACFL59_12620, partial [Planctomycetota bacterium]